MEKTEVDNLLVNLTVLYVEDDDATRMELARFLKRRVGRLYVGQNGEEGQRLYEEHGPDLIITDLIMPGVDGLGMVKNIRSSGGDEPVIITSALSDSDSILKAVDLGIIKYIIKPIDTNQLLTTMENLAPQILKNKLNKTELNDNIIINKKQKHELERAIASETAHFIKTFSGKGPQKVQVFISGDQLVIKANGVLTTFENSLMVNNRNNSLVDYNRKVFYRENQEVMENILKKIVGYRCNLEQVESDSLKDFDQLIFSIFLT